MMGITERFKNIKRTMDSDGTRLMGREAYVSKTDASILAIQNVDKNQLLSDGEKDSIKTRILISGPNQNDMPIIYGIQAVIVI